MTIWIIEPHDPLIVRDGRPFGPDPGARAVSLTFPFPSTTTGAVRTQAGRDAAGQFTADPVTMKEIAVRGPLLIELDDTDQISDWLFPAPADALLFAPDPPQAGQALCKRLLPLKLPAGATTDCQHNLALVGLTQPDQHKPLKNPPVFWHWRSPGTPPDNADDIPPWLTFARWLTAPPAAEPVDLADLGHSGPTRESRIHIQRDPTSRTAEERKLFETSGLEFTHPGQGQARLRDARRLALAVETDKVIQHPCPVDYLGGERRLVTWRVGNGELPPCPPALREQIIADKACRLILLTPTHFTQGFRPTWICTPRNGVTVELHAIAIQRPQIVSGWDFEHNRPKPTRRLAPAGTVLFLKLDGEPAAISTWIDATWMHCISDDDQDRRDGFGLAVPGTWDGRMRR
jgi:CRISPR-associated protein Cmr3